MSATNATPIINLPLFIGTDKPAWLTDWNGAMNIIDTSIAALQTAEAGTASSLATLAQSVTALSGTVEQHTTALQTVTEATATNTGSINTINSLIGNGTPTTTDQTIIGAINELNAGKASVNDITDGYVYTEDVKISALNDGVKTYGALVAEAVVSLATALSALDDDEYLTPNSVRVVGYCIPTNTSQRYTSASTAQIPYYAITGDLTALTITRGFLRASSPYHYVYGLTVADNTISVTEGLSDVATNPVELILHKYKKVR